MHVERAGLKVAPELAGFVENEVLHDLHLTANAFWAGVADIFVRFVPVNRDLLAKRDDLQARIEIPDTENLALQRRAPASFFERSIRHDAEAVHPSGL